MSGSQQSRIAAKKATQDAVPSSGTWCSRNGSYEQQQVKSNRRPEGGAGRSSIVGYMVLEKRIP